MADANGVSEYTVTLNGIEYTMQLNDADAKRYGDAAVKAAGAPASKARTPQNKGA